MPNELHCPSLGGFPTPALLGRWSWKDFQTSNVLGISWKAPLVPLAGADEAFGLDCRQFESRPRSEVSLARCQ